MKTPKQKPRPGTSIRFADRAAERAVRRAAELTGKGQSTFVRDAAEARAREVLAEHAGVCALCGRPRGDVVAA
jgi:uncharacterized protein (DUF1778 family)